MNKKAKFYETITFVVTMYLWMCCKVWYRFVFSMQSMSQVYINFVFCRENTIHIFSVIYFTLSGKTHVAAYQLRCWLNNEYSIQFCKNISSIAIPIKRRWCWREGGYWIGWLSGSRWGSPDSNRQRCRRIGTWAYHGPPSRAPQIGYLGDPR